MATADRWAPWIEPTVALAANQTINSTTPAILSGVAAAFTPHVNTRAVIPVAINAINSGPAGYTLIAGLLVNSVPQAARLNLILAPGLQDQATFLYSIDLLALTTYSFVIEAYVNVAGGSYLIVQNQSGLGPMTAMPNLHS